MAIQPTPKLETNPDVRIFFSGLMILQPSPDSKTCEVFVHRSAPNHQLTIEVREKQKNGPDLIKMRHVGPLPFAVQPFNAPAGQLPIHGMSIRVATAPKGIRAYTAQEASTEGEALALAINLDGEGFHDVDTGRIDRLNGRPSIALNDVVLYTADKTSPQLTIDLKKDGQQVRRLDPFASLIGGNIYLDNGDNVIVTWMAEGFVEDLILKKPANGNSYEIYIVNDPLYEPNRVGLPEHDELREYYKLLPDVALNQQFRLDVKVPQGVDPNSIGRGSTKTPCMSVLKVRP